MEWSKHILITPTSQKLMWRFVDMAYDVSQKLVTSDQIVTVVITRSRRVKSVEHQWNVRCDFHHIRSLPDKNSFFVNKKVRKLRESRKSTIYHIFLTKSATQLCCVYIDNYQVLRAVTNRFYSLLVCLNVWSWYSASVTAIIFVYCVHCTQLSLATKNSAKYVQK